LFHSILSSPRRSRPVSRSVTRTLRRQVRFSPYTEEMARQKRTRSTTAEVSDTTTPGGGARARKKAAVPATKAASKGGGATKPTARSKAKGLRMSLKKAVIRRLKQRKKRRPSTRAPRRLVAMQGLMPKPVAMPAMQALLNCVHSQ